MKEETLEAIKGYNEEKMAINRSLDTLHNAQQYMGTSALEKRLREIDDVIRDLLTKDSNK